MTFGRSIATTLISDIVEKIMNFIVFVDWPMAVIKYVCCRNIDFLLEFLFPIWIRSL